MPRFAVINNGSVVDLIIADTQEIAESLTRMKCVQYEEGQGVGHAWSKEEGFIGESIPDNTTEVINA